MNRRRIAAIALPLVPLLIVAVYLASTLGDDDEPPSPSVVDISASEPAYATVVGLAGASDRVLAGEVVAIEQGRAVTDPADPTAGVNTQLATVRVERVAKGPESATVVIEQEASLLDGTPITVNGVSPLVVGDRGWFFLIDGDGEQFPYTALTTVDGFAADGTPRADEAEHVAPGT